MKSLLLPLLLLGTLAGLAAPKIVCDQVNHEFGPLPNTAKVEHTFVIRNEGDQDLTVERVQPSCGCTVAEISQKTLAPGATARIPTVLDLNGKRGPMAKTITVHSNDPANPQFRLTLNGVATMDVEVIPAFLFLPSVPHGVVSTGLVSVAVSGTNLVSVTGVASSSPAVTAVIVNKEGRKGADIQVQAKVPEGGPLVTAGRLTFKTDNPRYPELFADYTFNIIDKITVVPTAMAFSLMTGPNAKPPVPVNRILRVRPGTVREFKVLEATWPLTGQKGNIVNLGPQGYQVTFENILPKAELNGESVILKTDVPGREQMKIPVSIASYGAGIPPGIPPPAPVALPASPAPVLEQPSGK